MATKKDFSELNCARLQDKIEDATAELAPVPIPKRSRSTPPTVEEVQTCRERGTTQGRKGIRATRINMAFQPDVHEYIRTMARVRGETVTQFTNYVFRQSLINNADLYDQAKQFLKNFNNKTD